MRGPLVGLSDQELLDITAELPEKNGRPNFFSVRTDPSAVQHPVAKAILACLRDLRGRAAVSTPSLILAEAIERLNVRVIMAARHRNRNARALANLDALIERARGYGIVGLRAFVRDLQADWERNVRAPEGRIDAAEHAIEVVTIHKAKGLEWPVVIPINSTTELYRPDQFVHRQSDNTLHWMVGGVAPPDLAAARAEESREDANQRERIWYVACTRARDLLILPSIPQASKVSWFSSIELRQQEVPELDLSNFTASDLRQATVRNNEQSAEVFEFRAAKGEGERATHRLASSERPRSRPAWRSTRRGHCDGDDCREIGSRWWRSVAWNCPSQAYGRVPDGRVGG